MKFVKRLRRLENVLQKKEGFPAIAIQYLNGKIDWAGRIYQNDEEFHTDVDRKFQNEPPTPGPRVILIKLWRDMKDISPVKSGTQPCS
jgi:hypothetical protein